MHCFKTSTLVLTLNPKVPMKKTISVIIPTWNEEGNISSLVTRLDQAFKTQKISYELIFIDDHSTDKTQEVILSYTNYPIRLYLKKGQKGKAFSIIEGFSYVKSTLIAIIDADLQYPPEVIPNMISKVEQGFDVVVADRKERQAGLLRNTVSRSFNLIFARMMHGFPVDVQSGLKVFKTEIAKRIKLTPFLV